MTGDEKGSGIDGGIAKREDPSAKVLNFIDAPSIENVSKSVTQNGEKIIQEKQAIPGVGYIVIIQDTEGNMFGLMQEDLNAK